MPLQLGGERRQRPAFHEHDRRHVRVGKITSRIGIEADATPLRKTDDIREIVGRLHAEQPVTAVLVDEVQFMTVEQAWQLSGIVDELKIPVMAYGLKNNVFGTLFSDAIVQLMALADDFQEIKQLCHCARKATMILRYNREGVPARSGEVVEVGCEGRYVSVCRRHWKDGDIGPPCRDGSSRRRTRSGAWRQPRSRFAPGGAGDTPNFHSPRCLSLGYSRSSPREHAMPKRGFTVFGVVALLVMAVGAGNFYLSGRMRISRQDLGIPVNLDDERCAHPGLARIWDFFDKDYPDYNAEVVAHAFGIYAAFASNAYPNEKHETFDLNPWDFGWARRGDPVDRTGGFYADVFHQPGDDRLSVMVVFRGTDGPADIPDMISNASYFTQMINPWDQYRTARSVFMDVRADAKAAAGDRRIEYYAVGHSLGGGLARHVAAAFPCVLAVTFNSSFVNNERRLAEPFIDYSKRTIKGGGRIIDVFEDNDPLSRAALFYDPGSFFRLNAQHLWFRVRNREDRNRDGDADDPGEHGILFAAQSMSRIAAECLQRKDCQLHSASFGGPEEVRKLYCVAHPSPMASKGGLCPAPQGGSAARAVAPAR